MSYRKKLEQRCRDARRQAEEFMTDVSCDKVEKTARMYGRYAAELLGKAHTSTWYDCITYKKCEELYFNAVESSLVFLNGEDVFMGWCDEQQDFIDTRVEEHKDRWFISVTLPTKRQMKKEIKEKY